MPPSMPLNLVRTRSLVGYLGEKMNFPWWPTTFYESRSRQFLEPVMPRTYRQARYYGVLEAARRTHDDLLSVGSYHLFRLPEEVEQHLHTIFQQMEEPDVKATETLGISNALDRLRRLAGSTTMDAVGPIAIGHISELNSPRTVQTIAAAYLSAFSHDVKAYPYLLG